MSKIDFKIGDIVTVVKYTPGNYAEGVVDELGTEELLQWMVGKDFEVFDFDEYGHLELRPKDSDIVWLEKESVVLKLRR